MGQVAMATDRSGRRTKPIGGVGSLIGCQDCKRRKGQSRRRSACCKEHRGGTAKWKQEEKVWKNSGRICENYEENTKKMKTKFLIERIC